MQPLRKGTIYMSTDNNGRLNRCTYHGVDIHIPTKEVIPTHPMTLQDIYSTCKELWLEQRDLTRYPFPFVAITDMQFETVHGWVIPTAARSNVLRGRWREDLGDGRYSEWHYASDIADYWIIFTESRDRDWDDDEDIYLEYM